MAKLSTTTKIVGGFGLFALLFAGVSAFFGKNKPNNQPALIEGECEEVVEDETCSDKE